MALEQEDKLFEYLSQVKFYYFFHLFIFLKPK